MQIIGKTRGAVVAHQSAPEIVPRELWEREFSSLHSIPSSLREEPAKALVFFADLLHLGEGTSVLDLGCGNGRNSIYLAQRGCAVTALDFATAAVMQTSERIYRLALGDRIAITQRTFEDAIPYPDKSFDFVLDSYVSCHFLSAKSRNQLYGEMARVVRPGGCVLSIGFSKDDQYYAQFVRSQSDQPLVCDPVNGIWKRIYSVSAIKASFEHVLGIQYFVTFEFDDVVLGSSFRRAVLCSVLRPKNT